MFLSNFVATPSIAFYVALPLALLGGVIWWLLRKRQVRVWLPTVRILDFETRLLPKLLFRPPPLLFFLAFLFTAVALTIMTLRPRVQVFSPFEPNQAAMHIFVDMSPSVAAHIDLDAYASQVVSLWTRLKKEAHVSVSTSHDGRIYEPADGAELQASLIRLGFHRAGVRLGSVLKDQLEVVGTINRLFIFSDQDQHSWSGFNWTYLQNEMDVLHVSIGDGKPRHNIFLSDARYLAAPGADTMEWDVDIARSSVKRSVSDLASDSGEAPEVTGTLTAEYRGELLGQADWSLASGTEKVVAHVAWPGSKAEALLEGSRAKDKSDDDASQSPLVWRITVNDKTADDLAMDNEFRTELHGMRQDVLLISESAGERPLEDPSHELEIALQVLGFRVKRHDFTDQPGPRLEGYPLWILVGGAGHGAEPKDGDRHSIDEHFCPRSLQQARLASMRTDGQHPPPSRWPRVWLVPLQVEADYEELCSCYGRLLISQSEAERLPAYCQHVQTRASWLELLPSLGAKQIGGDIGDQAATLAWLGHGPENGAKAAANDASRDPKSLSVLAFTVPLTPSQATGITHAQLPLLVKELLTWQGLLQPGIQSSGAAWPRYDDIGSLLKGSGGELLPTAIGTAVKVAGEVKLVPIDMRLKLRQSNVPLGESLLAEVSPSSLPPKWSTQLEAISRQLPAKKEREDPLPWLKWLAVIALSLCGLEALGLIGYRLAGLAGKAKSSDSTQDAFSAKRERV